MAFGKSIKSIEPSVSSVTLYGSSDVLDKIEQLEVKINVDGLEDDKEFSVTLDKPSGVNELSTKTIKVKVTVDKSIKKEFKNISVTVENLDPKYKAQALTEDDRQVTVIVSGSESIVNGIDISSIKAYVDLKDYTVGEWDVPVKVTGNDLKLSYESKVRKVKIRITEAK